MSGVLPEEFRDLEPFAVWALGSETERNRMRVTSDMTNLQAFSDAMHARAREILTYLCKFPLNDLPPEARTLQLMTLSWAEIGPAVEIFHQPTVPDAMGFERFVPLLESDGLNS